MERTPLGLMALRCAKCGSSNGLTWYNGVEICRKCYEHERAQPPTQQEIADAPCEMGSGGWEQCVACGRMSSYYCRQDSLRLCPACFAGHREARSG